MPAEDANDYFSLFGLPRSAVLDTDELAQRYRKLQSHVHPDRYAGAPRLQRQVALQHASRINDAYAVLKKPLARAVYLLSLYGVEVYAEQDTAMPTDFLQQMLEWREALVEEDDEQAGAALRQEIIKTRDAIAAEAAKTLEAIIAAEGGDTDAAYHLLRRWVYLEKLIGAPEFRAAH